MEKEKCKILDYRKSCFLSTVVEKRNVLTGKTGGNELVYIS